MNKTGILDIPDFYDSNKVGKYWKVDYQKIAEKAEKWADKNSIAKASKDEKSTALLLIDVQNTFCLPDFELFAAGRSGTGAVDDNNRLCQFIYRNLNRITRIFASMDTHRAAQIFHPVFLIDNQGNHPQPFTPISANEIESGKWRINPDYCDQVPYDSEEELSGYLKHYTGELDSKPKYDLMIWPYHAMLGGIGHALVSSVEEALFFHNIARRSQTHLELKGASTLTENYSIVSPEVMTDHQGSNIGTKNDVFIELIMHYDRVIVTGQAKSHCVAWTINDLLSELKERDAELAQKIYLLEDCTSPVVIGEEADFTDAANEAFARFAEAGMHRVKSTDPINSWPEF